MFTCIIRPFAVAVLVTAADDTPAGHRSTLRMLLGCQPSLETAEQMQVLRGRSFISPVTCVLLVSKIKILSRSFLASIHDVAVRDQHIILLRYYPGPPYFQAYCVQRRALRLLVRTHTSQNIVLTHWTNATSLVDFPWAFPDAVRHARPVST